MACVAVEMVVDVVERRWWGNEVMRWQEIEQERGEKGGWREGIDGIVDGCDGGIREKRKQWKFGRRRRW